MAAGAAPFGAGAGEVAVVGAAVVGAGGALLALGAPEYIGDGSYSGGGPFGSGGADPQAAKMAATPTTATTRPGFIEAVSMPLLWRREQQLFSCRPP